MICPKCKSAKIVPMNEEKNYLYCSSCSHAWKVGNEEESLKSTEGTLAFNGVPAAKKVFDLLTGGRSDMGPELRSALETQMTAVLFDQWFEGFKAGQLANIVYLREYYDGKTRSQQRESDEQHSDRDRSYNESTNGKNSGARASSPGPSQRPQRITELVGGVKFIYDSHIKVPENIYKQAGVIAASNEIERFEYTGKDLKAYFKLV